MNGKHILVEWKGFPDRASFTWELAEQVNQDLVGGSFDVLAQMEQELVGISSGGEEELEQEPGVFGPADRMEVGTGSVAVSSVSRSGH